MDMVTLVVDLFLDVLYALVDTGIDDVVVMINTLVSLVPSSISTPIYV